jgi:peptidase YpeB-like protein
MNELFVMALWAAYAARNVFSARIAPVMKKARQGLLPLTLLAVGFAPFSQAYSMPGPVLGGAAAREQLRAPQVMRDGISLDEAVRRAEQQYRARVVRTDVQDEDGRTVYVLKLLSEDGRVITVRIDAATGRMR